MRKLILLIALVAVLAPAAALAADTPSSSSPAQDCKAKLKADGNANFISAYAPGKSVHAAYAACVSQKTHAASENAQNAAKQCAAALKADAKTFASTWGANGNTKNAMGKCVSATTKKLHDTQESTETKASAACKAEQKSLGTAQ